MDLLKYYDRFGGYRMSHAGCRQKSVMVYCLSRFEHRNVSKQCIFFQYQFGILCTGEYF